MGLVLVLSVLACGPQREAPATRAPPNELGSADRATGQSGGNALDQAGGAHGPGQHEPLIPLHAVYRPVLNDEARAARQAAQFRLLEESPYGDEYVAAPRILERDRTDEEIAELQAAALAAAELAQPDATVELAELPGSAGPNPDGSPPAAAANPATAGTVGDDTTPTASEKVRFVDAHSLGRYVPLEGAGDAALASFHGALRELETLAAAPDAGPDADSPRKVRIAFYGSSQTSADFITHYLRVYLQARFGDGGHGFVALAKPWRYYRHLDVGVKTSRRWHTDHAQKSNRRDDGWYALAGLSTSAKRRRDYSTITARGGAQASRFDVLFLKQPRGGRFRLEVDGQTRFKFNTRAKRYTLGLTSFELPLDLHEFTVRPRGDGEVRLFGMIMENDQSGVVLDTLGINGARAANHLVWDEPMWAQAFQRRAPKLYVLAYGANESIDVDQPMAEYERDLRSVLDRFARAAPEASCLLVGPGDFPEKAEDGSYHPRTRLREIKAAQRRVAVDYDCAFWDTQGFMGGEMGITQWVAAEPRMASDDHLHLTRRGYTRMGMALADAIMQGYDGAGAGVDEQASPEPVPDSVADNIVVSQ